MTGTPNQIELAEQIRPQVDADFRRVASALGTVAGRQTGETRDRTLAIIAIVDLRRAEVLANPSAGYFIVNWRELSNQVWRGLADDPRYRAIREVSGSPRQEKQWITS